MSVVSNMRARQRQQIGLKEAVSLGIGGVIGAGIFVLSGVASGKAGPAVIISFVLAFIASTILGFCYAELSSLFPKAGGPYAFAREAFGPRIGALVGWAYWGAWVSASGYVALGFGNHLALFVKIPPALGAAGLILVFVLLNLLGIRVSGRVQVLIMFAEISALVLFTALGISHIDISNYTPFMPTGVGGVLSAALIGFLSLTGWDVIVVAAEEIRDAKRNVPLAIFGSLAIVLLLYTGLLIVANGMMPWYQLGQSSTPISDASQRFLGTRGPAILSSIILVALTATANSFLIVISRTAYAMSRDGLGIPWLAKTFGKNETPWAAVIVAGLAQLLVTVLGSIQFATSATGFLYLLTFVVSGAALIAVRRKGQVGHFRMPGYPYTAVVALVICGGMLLTSGTAGIISGLIWLAIGVAFYWSRGWSTAESPGVRV